MATRRVHGIPLATREFSQVRGFRTERYGESSNHLFALVYGTYAGSYTVPCTISASSRACAGSTRRLQVWLSSRAIRPPPDGTAFLQEPRLSRPSSVSAPCQQRNRRASMRTYFESVSTTPVLGATLMST